MYTHGTTRRFFLHCLFVWGIALTIGSCIQAASQRPNIILIVADDLGYGELGSYGQERIETPHLDQMAADGMRWTHFYAGSTVCAPSRCVILTGKHTGRCTVRGNAGAANPGPQTLRPTDITVASQLRKAGYATGLVGKWGLGDEPNGTGHPRKQGFDYFFGYLSQLHAHNHFPDFLWRNEERVALKNQIVPVGTTGAGYATNRVEFAGDLLATEALQFIDRHKSGPFFLLFTPVVPHANNERRAALGNGMEVPDFGPYARRNWSDALKGHAAMITRLDADVGRLLQRLRAHGIDRNTLVLFTSDNGPHKEGGQDPEFFDPNGPLRGYKRDLTDGGIRVPLISWWPGRVPAGMTTDHVASFADFFPSFTELAGLGPKPVKKLTGKSFLPTLFQSGYQKPHKYLYWEFHESGSSQAVLYRGYWKGIRLKRRDAPLVLYNLHDDPTEVRDVAKSNPRIVEAIEELMKKARKESPDWPLKDAPLPATTNAPSSSGATPSPRR